MACSLLNTSTALGGNAFQQSAHTIGSYLLSRGPSHEGRPRSGLPGVGPLPIGQRSSNQPRPGSLGADLPRLTAPRVGSPGASPPRTAAPRSGLRSSSRLHEVRLAQVCPAEVG